MSPDLIEWQRIQQAINHLVDKTSIDHLIFAHKVKMTLFEISKCKEISELKNIPLERVFHQMAAFKESSAYLLYHRDFTYGH